MRDRLLLASNSPRRAEMLARVGLAFELCPSDVDETLPPGAPPAVAAVAIARRKADASVHLRRGTVPPGRRRDEVVLAADTIVVLGDTVLGKPADDADARRMLRMLAGRVHAVITGFALVRGDGTPLAEAGVRTEVEFKPLEDAEIDGYVATGEPRDKAGGYAIQGAGGFMVRRIDGSYSNVVGLPLVEVLEALAAHTTLRPFARTPGGGP